MSKYVNDIKIVAVIGAGTMGSGIAQVVASHEREVLLLDISDAVLDRGIKIIDKSLNRLIKKEEIDHEDRTSILGRITTTTNFDDLRRADFVIEAVFEDREVKKDIYSKLDQVTKEGVILATNTS